MIILLISVTLLLGISQTLLYIWQTPPGTVYPMVHNFIEDFYQYLDIMRQGYDGWWVATSRMTPEVYPRMFVSVFLLFLGHTARVFHISLPVAYFGARVLGGGVLMVLVYQLIRKIFPESYKARIVAFCFVLFSTYVWGWGPNGPVVGTLAHAWTELDPIFRWSFVPHHLWSKVFMLSAFLLLLRPFPFSFYLLPFFVVLMGFTNPVVYVTFIPTLLLYAVLSLRGESLRATWQSLIAIGVAGVVLLYHRYLQLNIFPWTSYLLWEQTLKYKVNPFEYAMSLGPILILFVLAIPTLWHMGKVGRLLLSWAGSSWLMLYVIGPFVPVTPERFLGGYQFIPLGIGAAVWIFSLKRRGLFRLGIVVLLFCYFVVGLYASFKEHAGYVAANRYNPQVYVPKELMDAFAYLSTHGSSEDVGVAPYEISTMIPAFTGRRVLAGHAMFTKDVAAKKTLINDFFAGKNPVLPKDTAWLLAPSLWIPSQNSPMTKKYTSGSYTIFEIQ